MICQGKRETWQYDEAVLYSSCHGKSTGLTHIFWRATPSRFATWLGFLAVQYSAGLIRVLGLMVGECSNDEEDDAVGVLYGEEQVCTATTLQR